MPTAHLAQADIASLHAVILALVHQDGRDLSLRQLAVLLTIHQLRGPHTVRGLASRLQVSKPAISRALDRLGAIGLTRRAVDPKDRRNVLAHLTKKGADLVADIPKLRNATERAGPPVADIGMRDPS